jgi:hypothetical protein
MRSFCLYPLIFSIVLLVASSIVVPCWSGMNVDIAISTDAGWWKKSSSEREMGEVVKKVEDQVKSIKLFAFAEQDGLAVWVTEHTGNGQLDVLILCGTIPDSIYPFENKQPEGSIAENFLEDGNMIINTGNWMFFLPRDSDDNANGAGGLQNMMDIPDITMWNETNVIITEEGEKYLPSLENSFTCDRPFHLDELQEPWEAEIIFAANASKTRADPVVVHDTDTDGRIAIIYQTRNNDNLPVGAVFSEFLLNWFPTIPPAAVEPHGKISSLWGQLKLSN